MASEGGRTLVRRWLPAGRPPCTGPSLGAVGPHTALACRRLSWPPVGGVASGAHGLVWFCVDPVSRWGEIHTTGWTSSLSFTCSYTRPLETEIKSNFGEKKRGVGQNIKDKKRDNRVWNGDPSREGSRNRGSFQTPGNPLTGGSGGSFWISDGNVTGREDK